MIIMPLQLFVFNSFTNDLGKSNADAEAFIARVLGHLKLLVLTTILLSSDNVRLADP
jgi:hypothetical protein